MRTTAALIDLLPGWLVEAGYEAIARGLHAGIAVGALMLATALAMAALLRSCPSADPERGPVHFLTPGLNATRRPAEASRDAEASDGSLSAHERFSGCPRASTRRSRAEMPATALRSPAGPA
jgi:hypothetical protein